MSYPKPEPGLVFRYDYLWKREAKAGRSTSKDRPACLVVVTDSSVDPRVVVILPITHSRPFGGSVGVEIPPVVRRNLDLDDQKCWIVVSEANVDKWPNAGITRIPNSHAAFSYGFLPPGLFAEIKKAMLRHLDLRRSVRR